jgi:hypothetical protein
MQDRFKFRCWDKVQQQMHYDDFIITSVGKIHKPFPSSLEMGTIQGNDDEIAYRYLQFDQAENNDNSVIVMQCTGKKDKNGKLIYENDLLKDGKGQIGKVFWHSSTCSFAVNWLMKDGSYETDNCFGYGEIIGNIYENPELLY